MSADRLPIQAHLSELRRRLIICFGTVSVLFVLCYVFSGSLVSFLFFPVRRVLPEGSTMVFTALTEGFLTYLKVAFWAALIFSMPVFLHQVWGFISPGLYGGEKRLAKRFVGWGMGLFAAGGGFGYWVIMPVVLSITLGFADEGLEPMPRLQSYLLFALKTIFTFGLVFEIPFLMAFAARSGVVSPNYFQRHRKASYIVLYVLAVMLVPADLFSQIMLFLPFMGIYEIGVRLSRFLSFPEGTAPA